MLYLQILHIATLDSFENIHTDRNKRLRTTNSLDRKYGEFKLVVQNVVYSIDKNSKGYKIKILIN